MNEWWQRNFPNGQQQVTITSATGQSVQIAWGECGRGAPLVLLHGWGTWSHSWQSLLPILSQQFRVICFDAKGYGYSERTVTPDVMGHQIVEAQQVIQAICGDEPVYLVGESLGAFITLALAEEQRCSIRALAVIAPPIYPHIMPNWSMRIFARLPRFVMRSLDHLRIIHWIKPLVIRLAHQQQSEVYHRPEQVSREMTQEMLAPYFDHSNSITPLVEDTRLAALELAKLQQQVPNLIQQVQAQLNTITCPSLVLWGARDKWFPVADGERLQQALPNAVFQALPDCGHHASGDCAAEVAAAILTFFAGVPAEDKAANLNQDQQARTR